MVGDYDDVQAPEPDKAKSYGITFEGNRWSDNQRNTVLDAAGTTESRLKARDRVNARMSVKFGDYATVKEACSLCNYTKPGEAWQAVFGQITARRDEGTGGAVTTDHVITFFDDAFDKVRGAIFTAIHEFAHVLANSTGKTDQGVQIPYKELHDSNVEVNGVHLFGGDSGRRSDAGHQRGNPYFPYQQDHNCCREDFADMFMNWTLNTFADDAYGRARYAWIDDRMDEWTTLAVAKK